MWRAAIRVRAVQTDADRAAWHAYLLRAAGRTCFHEPAWCAAVAATFGHAARHLIALRGTEPAGILPLMEVHSLIGGRMLVSVPYGTYGGILADDPAARMELADEAMRLADERGARVLDLRSATPDVPGLDHVTGYLGFARDLPQQADEVGACLPKRARAAARHARDRAGVVVRHDPQQAELVWRLYCRSMRRIGSLNYPWRFFQELLARFAERAWVSVAWLGERALAGTISFVHGDTLMPYILGADERVHCDGVANLLYWSVMERAVAAGLRRFDYGRSRADNAGAVGFKKNQGFEPQPLGYQRYVPPGRRAPDLRPSSPRFTLARQIWQRLPLAATRIAGAWLARSIPG
ncbi:MAG: FemAB family XrtA/PEP-CTERM system-associated protein [Planctomycetota bacterium]